MERFVIIGAGAAGITAARTLREARPEAVVTVISIDRHIHSRCMLHKYLGQERDIPGISFVEPDFFEKNDIVHIPCERVERIDTAGKTVYFGEGFSAPYDKLLIATGAAPFVPPIPHFREAGNVFTFRDLSDAQAIDRALSRGKRVFIVGSGLVGLDAASALCERGAAVTVAEMADRVMPLQTRRWRTGSCLCRPTTSPPASTRESSRTTAAASCWVSAPATRRWTARGASPR